MLRPYKDNEWAFTGAGFVRGIGDLGDFESKPRDLGDDRGYRVAIYGTMLDRRIRGGARLIDRKRIARRDGRGCGFV